MLVRAALRPYSKDIHDGAKQLLSWVFAKNRKISSTSIANERFKDQKAETFDLNDKDDLEKLENFNEEFPSRSLRNEKYGGYNRRDRYDDGDHIRSYRRDGFDRSGGFDRDYRNDRIDRFDRDNTFNRFNRYGRYERRPFYNSYTNISQMKDIKWESEKLSTFKKDFYSPQPTSLNRSAEEIEKFYKTHSITLKGKDFPPPVFSFDELGLPEEIKVSLRSFNYSEPTPIQSVGCPIALSGRDMVGISRTGSGKTLAYILPAAVHIKNQPPLGPGDGPIALVVAPTRELVQQIKDVAKAFRHITTSGIFGGADRHPQAMGLTRGVHICVATPGRLLDFLSSGTTNLKRCTYLVLDEADRMFDMGFEPQIREIIEHVRPDRQVLMWSATWPREIRSLAAEHLKDYIQINVGSSELSANPNIKQIVHVCQERDKRALLKEVLNEIRNEGEKKTLIFTRTKSKADEISYWLNSNGFRAVAMHGDKTQNNRNISLNKFRSGRILYLVATSVAARGLDVQDIKYVINYDFPETIEDYVHRIGRTARHESSGTAHSFFTDASVSKVDELIEILKRSNQEVNPELLTINNFSKKFSGSKRRNSWS